MSEPNRNRDRGKAKVEHIDDEAAARLAERPSHGIASTVNTASSAYSILRMSSAGCTSQCSSLSADHAGSVHTDVQVTGTDSYAHLDIPRVLETESSHVIGSCDNIFGPFSGEIDLSVGIAGMFRPRDNGGSSSTTSPGLLQDTRAATGCSGPSGTSYEAGTLRYCPRLASNTRSNGSPASSFSVTPTNHFHISSQEQQNPRNMGSMRVAADHFCPSTSSSNPERCIGYFRGIVNLDNQQSEMSHLPPTGTRLLHYTGPIYLSPLLGGYVENQNPSSVMPGAGMSTYIPPYNSMGHSDSRNVSRIGSYNIYTERWQASTSENLSQPPVTWSLTSSSSVASSSQTGSVSIVSPWIPSTRVPRTSHPVESGHRASEYAVPRPFYRPISLGSTGIRFDFPELPHWHIGMQSERGIMGPMHYLQLPDPVFENDLYPTSENVPYFQAAHRNEYRRALDSMLGSPNNTDSRRRRRSRVIVPEMDVDNMSYEDLLALGNRIGSVGSGLTEQRVLELMRQRRYEPTTEMPTSTEEPCAICCENFSKGDNVGTLECGHDYHTDCIKQWLVIKNLCPICKATALKL